MLFKMFYFIILRGFMSSDLWNFFAIFIIIEYHKEKRLNDSASMLLSFEN